MAVRFKLKNKLITNLENLNYSMDNMKKIIRSKFRDADMLAVCFLDISNLRFYNYKFGYEYGDKILETIKRRVGQVVKNYGYVYRFGGGALIILLDRISSKNEVIAVAEHVAEIFDDVFSVDIEQLRILVNMGISVYPEDSKDIDDIIKFSEIALNYCKKCYGHKYIFFEHRMYEEIINRGKMEANLINAIYNREFTLYYQPQVDINTMKIYGMEALLRWNHPEKGLILPGNFIDIVERNGMINEIGKFVLEEACRQIREWHKLGYNDLSISINLSEKQLEDDSFMTFLNRTLKKNQVNPRYIEFEITERILVNPSKKILNVLSSIRNLGIRIFIDDFGTKHSSLNYLYCFPIDGIKIDKSFVDRMICSDKDFIITKNIINLAHELKLEVIAEGVEQNEQLEKLKSVNCTKIQGFIFGKPINPDESINLLMEFNS